MQKSLERTLDWEDLDYIAVLSTLNGRIDQCSIRHGAGHEECAHLFLTREGLMSLVDINLPHDENPDDSLLVAIGRVVFWHKRFCLEHLESESKGGLQS